MSRPLAAAVSLVAALVVPADLVGQHEHPPSPYTGQEGRDIKALSQEEVEELQTGQGMGLARAAELNGVSGPRHVLDLAAELDLTDEQREAVETIFRRMREEAVALGEEILRTERELDRAFATHRATGEAVADLTGRIGALGGRLRAVHLTAHLETAAVLTHDQVAAYSRLRGYGASGAR